MSTEQSVPALAAPARKRDNPLTRSFAGILGLAVLAIVMGLCLFTLPYTTGSADELGSTPRYNAGSPKAGRLPPSWWPASTEQARRLNGLVEPQTIEQIAQQAGINPADAVAQTEGPVADELREHWPSSALGTDAIGRSLFLRLLTGGGISLGIGIAAALLSVFIGTAYGVIAGYMGGRVDAVMMRIVDILYGLPYILLVVLLAVAGDALVDEYISRSREREQWVVEQAQQVLVEQGEPAGTNEARLLLAEDEELSQRLNEEKNSALPPREISSGTRDVIGLVILLVAIGGVSWLTMARVIRGQVLSLKAQPFMEAARAVGVPLWGQFTRHLLPNLTGPIVVYATLTVPQAILQESFLSFLGIGVRPPLPSWGNLAADGLIEMNRHGSNWWLLLFPCLMLAITLVALNFVGEGLREAVDPKRAKQ